MAETRDDSKEGAKEQPKTLRAELETLAVDLGIEIRNMALGLAKQIHDDTGQSTLSAERTRGCKVALLAKVAYTLAQKAEAMDAADSALLVPQAGIVRVH